jgi:hypothetical protein
MPRPTREAVTSPEVWLTCDEPVITLKTAGVGFFCEVWGAAVVAEWQAR